MRVVIVTGAGRMFTAGLELGPATFAVLSAKGKDAAR